MNKEHILSEIRRTAKENGGKALGKMKFLQETGIKESDWYGKYWNRWSDAVEEAGLKPNKMQGAFEGNFLLEKFVELIRELGRYPVKGDLLMKARSDPDFPSQTTFQRFGSKPELATKCIEFCSGREGFEDVIYLCEEIAEKSTLTSEEDNTEEVEFGYVYLMKSGKYYKIGRSKSVGRREYELAIQLPEKLNTIHVIKTDDPIGIELYWHQRFEDKRKHGEWFELKAADVSAFKRRKFM